MQVRELPEKENQFRSWLCGVCNSVWFDEEVADKCCKPIKCLHCSSQVPPGGSVCVHCRERARTAQDEQLFRTAEKVFFIDYEGRYLCWTPPGGRAPELFVSKTEVEKRCAELNTLPPRWCWAAEECGFLLDAEQALVGAVTRDNGDVRSLLDDEQVEELQRLLDDWAMNLPVKSYEENHEVAVIFDRTLYEAVASKQRS